MTHIQNRSKLDRDLSDLRDDMVRMSSHVEAMTEKVVSALLEHNLDKAREVRAEEKLIDSMRYEIEEKCITTLAMQAPLARDLRIVIAASHIAVEIERMADYDNGIAKIVLRLGDAAPVPWMPDFRSLQVKVCTMLRSAQEAYLKSDLNGVRQVMAMDGEVDRLYKAIQSDLFEVMGSDPATIGRAQSLLWVAHNLERLGDRVTNVCERIVFMLTGELHEDKKRSLNQA